MTIYERITKLERLESTTEALELLNTLKSMLVKLPVLALDKPYRSYMIDANASAYTLDAVLIQQ